MFVPPSTYDIYQATLKEVFFSNLTAWWSILLIAEHQNTNLFNVNVLPSHAFTYPRSGCNRYFSLLFSSSNSDLTNQGQSGIDFCNLALSSPHNHTLTLYVRNPTKVPEAISNNVNVAVIKGTLEDEAMLKIAASCGAKIFVSFAGPTGRLSGTVSLNCTSSIFITPSLFHPWQSHLSREANGALCMKRS